MAFEFLSDEKTYRAAGRYLYSGAFNGFLATGGIFFFTAFMLFWPITTAFTAAFVVTTTFSTLAAIYLLYRDDTRRENMQALNDKTKKIKQLYDEIQYYEDKLLREQTLLQTPETKLNPHKCINEDDLEIIRRKIKELKALYDDSNTSLPKLRQIANKYVDGFIQRHIIGAYKAFITSYVFYMSFPLFIALAINAIIAPTWIVPLAIPILAFSAVLGAFGLFKSYLDESREITTYDAAIEESLWIENSARELVESCERLLTDKITTDKRREVEKKDNITVQRKNAEQKKPSKYFLIKSADELRKRIPLLNFLAKPLGERLPKSAFEIASPKTLGKAFGKFLHTVSQYFYQWTLLSATLDYIARLIFMAIMGAIVPGGVALYLKFVLGVTFTPLLVNVYTIGLIITTVASIFFSFFHTYWSHQEAQLKTYSDHVSAIMTEVTEDLKHLHQERAQIQYDVTKDTRIRVLNKESRQAILERKYQLEKASRKLAELSDKMNEDNFFMSLVKWISIVYNSITTGYAWYMGFPLFVFLTLVTFVPITAPIITFSLFAISLAVGFLGMVYTFDTAAQGVECANAMINEAKTQSNAANELLKHFDKVLLNKDLSTDDQTIKRLSNDSALFFIHADKKESFTIPDYSKTAKFDLLQGLRKPDKPKHQNFAVNDSISLDDMHETQPTIIL